MEFTARPRVVAVVWREGPLLMKRWLLLIALVVVSVAFVALPLWLVRPFSPQTPRSLAVYLVGGR